MGVGEPRERGQEVVAGSTPVDASVLAAAERPGVAEITTLDRRHFTVVQSLVGLLTLVP